MRGRRLHRAVALTAFVVPLCGATASVHAALIGPVVNNTYTGSDSGGQRVNIDQTNPIVLDPGTYTASSFTFFAINASATTFPFLVVNSDLLTPNPSTDVDQYRVIAVGSTIATVPAPNNAPQTFPFGGGANATFILTAPTKVFAAVSSGNGDINSIGFIGEGSVDHTNGFTGTFAVGDTTPVLTNPDLGRTYGFNIDVGPGVPEPTSAAVLVLTGGMLLRRRIRRE